MSETPKRLSPVQQVALGLVLCAVGTVVGLACGSGTQSLPALVECQLSALRVLPQDPDQATLGDARDVVHRIRDCFREHPPEGDAGSP